MATGAVKLPALQQEPSTPGSESKLRQSLELTSQRSRWDSMQRSQSFRIKKLAKQFEENMNESDIESTSKQRVKFVAMGGSCCDSTCRMVCTVISLGLFCFLALFYTSVYRNDHGLRMCYALTDAEEPFSKVALEAVDREEEAVDVSDHWQILFYSNLGASVYAILQITIARIAYANQSKHTICDKLVLPITAIHMPISLGSFIWCHVARFAHSGRVCSGDFLSEE